MKYDPIENRFVEYEVVETPRVKIQMPLINEPIDISDWASSVKEDGTIIAQNNLNNESDMIEQEVINNPEPVQEPIAVSNPEPIAVKTSNNVKGNKKVAMDFFINKGLSVHAAAGIVGNLIHESGGLNTTAQGDYNQKTKKYTAYGLAQWRLDRKTGLINFAKSRGKDPSDFETQLEWVWKELNTGYKKTLNGLLASTNVREATKIFMDTYERPNAEYAHFQDRLNYANSLLS